jgi:hypothetical protein
MAKPPQIKPLGTTGSYIKMALVGGHGVGKTVFAATAPNALFAMSDKEGAESARNMGVGAGNEEWAINHFDQGDNSLTALYDYMVAEGCNDYSWLVHDNVTVENKLAMGRAMEIMNARPGSRQDPFVPDKPQYQRSQNQFQKMVIDFFDLPINQLWIVHPRLITMADPETGEDEEIITAQIQNDQVAEWFLGMVPIVGMVTQRKIEGRKEPVRRIYFSHRGPYRGKDRTHALGNYKDNLTIPRMTELIEARRASNKPARTRVTRPTKTAASRRRRTA